MSTFIHSWQQILSSCGSKINLKRDKKEFKTLCKVLAARRKYIVNQGMGSDREESQKLKLGYIRLCFDQETNQNYLELMVLKGGRTHSGENPSSHSQQRTFNLAI